MLWPTLILFTVWTEVTNGDVLVIVSLPDADVSICVEPIDLKRALDRGRGLCFLGMLIGCVQDEYKVSDFIFMVDVVLIFLVLLAVAQSCHILPLDEIHVRTQGC